MKRPRLRHPVPAIPHMPGLFELERLADETVILADQIKRTVADLRRQSDVQEDADDGAID